MRALIALLAILIFCGCKLRKSNRSEVMANQETSALMTFVKIPMGRGVVGSPVSEPGRDRGEDQREVNFLQGFEITETEITQKQWLDAINWIKGNDPSLLISESPALGREGDTLPVNNISLREIMIFLNGLNARNDGYKYRLPTSDEWEYATRSGTTGPYSGDGVTVSNESLKSADIAWFSENSLGEPKPVAGLKPNRYGLYDTHGNVAEWTSSKLALGEAFIRGGSFDSHARQCRSASFIDPGVAIAGQTKSKSVIAKYVHEVKFRSVGFRVVREIRREP